MSKKLLGNYPLGRLFVISAPSGTGKSTLVEMLIREFPDVVAESCSCTTRAPRSSEIPGQHYHFISVEEFQDHIQKGDFLEHVQVFGHYYGTLRDDITALRVEGKHVILVIDTQGALQIKGQIDAVFIFISPPSEEELRVRLLRRQTEDEASINKRLAWAKLENEMISHYDYHIINDQITVSYQILKSIIIAEEHRRKNVT